MAVLVLAIVILYLVTRPKPSGYFVPTEEVGDFALRMETRIGRLETLVAQGKIDEEVTEACIETIRDVNDFVVALVEGE